MCLAWFKNSSLSNLNLNEKFSLQTKLGSQASPPLKKIITADFLKPFWNKGSKKIYTLWNACWKKIFKKGTFIKKKHMCRDYSHYPCGNHGLNHSLNLDVDHCLNKCGDHSRYLTQMTIISLKMQRLQALPRWRSCFTWKRFPRLMQSLLISE